jgi:hypothetical protein
MHALNRTAINTLKSVEYFIPMYEAQLDCVNRLAIFAATHRTVTL